MISDRDHWTAANEMVKLHQENAPLEAAKRADELLASRVIDGQRTWLRIIKAVEWLIDERGADPFKVAH